MLAPRAPDSAGVNNKRLQESTLANRAFQQVWIRAPPIVRRRHSVMLSHDLVDGPLLVLVVQSEVVTTRSILCFNDNQDRPEPQDDVRLYAASKAWPEPAIQLSFGSGLPIAHVEPLGEEVPCLQHDEHSKHHRCERILSPFGFGNGRIELAVKQRMKHEQSLQYVYSEGRIVGRERQRMAAAGAAPCVITPTGDAHSHRAANGRPMVADR